MQKNEKNLNTSSITTESKENTISSNIQILTQLEKDIIILINYIRTNPLDFSNNLIKNSKNKTLTEEQIDLIKFLEEKYNKEQLLPFHEIPEISQSAKNLLYNISQNDSIFDNKNKTKIKSSALNLRTRLSNYGLRTGRIFSNVIWGIENPEDIVNHILKDENGRNMLLSNKMKFIGIGCCLLPSNKICSVIDIVQDFMPFKKSKKNNIKYNKYISTSFNIGKKDNKKENSFPSNMNIIINNSNNNEYVPNLMNNKHNNQRKKNELYENSNNENIYKTPNISSMDSNEQKSYKSYNIIINNNKIVPIRNNLSNINEVKEDDIHKNNNSNYFNIFNQNNVNNSSKVGMGKSKSVYGFKLNTEGRGTSSITRYQKLNRKEKLEILHKINQRKNNNSMTKNSTNFENLIPLSPEYSKNKSKNIANDKYTSPLLQNNTKKIFNNLDSDSNMFEFNETMPNYQLPNLDNEPKVNELKNDLIILKNQLKEELKLEVKNELKQEMKQEFQENTTKNIDINKNDAHDNHNKNNKNNHKRNFSKSNIIYHKRYKSDFFVSNKNIKNAINNNKSNAINQNNYQSFNNIPKKNIYSKEDHRIKNKKEIKKLIRLYNKEKDIKRSKSNANDVNNIINNNNNISNNNQISNFFFGYKNNNINFGNNNINDKGIKYKNDKTNLFLIKYQKAKPKDQTFKLIKNKTNTKVISKLCLKEDIKKQIPKPMNDIKLIKDNNNSIKKNEVYIINSYRNRNKAQNNMKENSIEEYLNDENYEKEKKKYKTPEKRLKQIINKDDIIMNSEDKKNFHFRLKSNQK